VQGGLRDIGDSRLGGCYSHRLSKAALINSCEPWPLNWPLYLSDALCIALHPGKVATALSAPFALTGLEIHPPAAAARHLFAVLDQLKADANGGLFDWRA
jgi:hypothetical protein